jgi:hypothetical protein
MSAGSADPHLAVFQQAAVRHIVSRLRDRRGSKRFLLADEVGLGKTHVARGVIAELAKRKPTLNVVYLCSNSEIASQNRPKLVQDPGQKIGRATELVDKKWQGRRSVTLYAFTPGTSMKRGTGQAHERKLIMYLLNRCTGADVNRRTWREFFRCGSGESWLLESRWSRVHGRFAGHVSAIVQTSFKEALREATHGERPLIEALTDEVARFNSSDREAKRRRNRLVAEVRHILQRVALRSIKPDLVILDEVQRFREVLEQSGKKEHVASELLASGTPTLILSATPYRAYTPEHEVEEFGRHHEDFFEALGFLFDRDTQTPKRIKRNLEEFGRHLRNVDPTAPRDDQLVGLKRKIEKDLRSVVCRTERNWYALDARHHVTDKRRYEGQFPTRSELQDYFTIHRGLTQHLDGPAMVTEFWKSAPSMLTFMDAGYSLIRRLRDSRSSVPRRLIAKGNDRSLSARNPRFRHLVANTLGVDREPPRLWASPSYRYYGDAELAASSPRKMLVFSGWRFVPKSIAVVLSQTAIARVGVDPEDNRQPLRLTERNSFHVFDVCYPSPALAELANPRASAKIGGALSIVRLVADAKNQLRKHLRDAGVDVRGQASAPLWKAIARLESHGPNATLARRLVGEWRPDGLDGSDGVPHHRQQFSDWLGDRADRIAISERDLGRLSMVALFSPATNLLRSLQSVYEPHEVNTAAPLLMQVCFGALRRYFNRPINQQIVRQHAGGRTKQRSGRTRGFSRRVLEYAADFQFQAVVDEHSFLLRHAGVCDTAMKAIAHYESVWSLGRGTRRTNGAKGNGTDVLLELDAHHFQTHFALAFGEDEAADGNNADRQDRERRSVIREAFNSPFWPFVLATTSVGQEGLDFHWYCRDVFHWNLPSNPVDLEQREGRVNRRDSLAVRASIARDWPLDLALHGRDRTLTNPWRAVFERLEADETPQRYKHGLYPHWLYECRRADDTIGVARHVAFHDQSRDALKYEHLKRALALYRLVFGQANQDDLLAQLAERLATLDPGAEAAARRKLAGYMLNLSPVGAAVAEQLAHEEASSLLSNPDRSAINRLLDHAEQMCVEHADGLGKTVVDIKTLCDRVTRGIGHGGPPPRGLRSALVALCYLRNPYDQFFDFTAAGGFDDDIALIRKVVGKYR